MSLGTKAATRATDEDCAEYWIIFPDTSSCPDVTEIFASVLPFLNAYIWQNEKFRLTFKASPVAHFYGTTNYGDNVEDEWFIVFLLFQISKAFPGAIIRLTDFDGELLLIEAADCLPKWVNPEIAENRVFISGGSIHLIPQSLKKPSIECQNLSGPISSLWHGAKVVQMHCDETANRAIQSIIEKRIKVFHSEIESFWHHASCLVPPVIAAALKRRPQMVSDAVRAIYLADMTDLKTLRKSKIIPTDMLLKTRVRFTRCLYAQLTHKRFHPDASSGWTPLSPTDSNYKAYELGMKLTHGFELCCASMKNPTENPTSSGLDEGYLNSLSWKLFLQRLSTAGYFRGNIKGSKEHNVLLEEAKHYFVNQGLDCDNSTMSDSLVIDLLKPGALTSADVESLKVESENLQPNDDESWLNVGPGELEKMLNVHFSENEIHKETSSFTNELQQYLEKETSVNVHGVEAKTKKNFKIEFKPEEFTNALKGLMQILVDSSTVEEDRGSPEMDSYSDEESDISLTEEADALRGADKKSSEQVKMLKYMAVMDKELSATTIGESFVPSNELSRIQQGPASLDAIPRSRITKSPGADSIDLEGDEFVPVNIDKNLVTNMLESYRSEKGVPGPASSLLHGIKQNQKLAGLDSDDSEYEDESLFDI